MSDSDVAAIERLLSDFAWHADRGEGTSLSQLFVPNGLLRVSGIELKGRLEIADDCHRRFEKPNRKTRHLWSNLRIDRIDGDAAASFAIQVTLEQSGPEEPTQVRVNDLVDEFQKDADGNWKIAKRIIDRKMAFSIA